MTNDAQYFVFMSVPTVYPMPASTTSWRYLFPQMSAGSIEPVVSHDTTSSGAYLFWLFDLNGLFSLAFLYIGRRLPLDLVYS